MILHMPLTYSVPPLQLGTQIPSTSLVLGPQISSTGISVLVVEESNEISSAIAGVVKTIKNKIKTIFSFITSLYPKIIIYPCIIKKKKG